MHVRSWPLLFVVVLAGCAASPSATGTEAAPATTAPSSAATTAGPSSPAAGCEFHRIEDAMTVLDGDLNPTPKTKDVEPGSTDNLFVSCVYWTADESAYSNVSLRKPLTPAGAADNRKQFTNQRTADAVAVSGIGDQAYWDTPNGQIMALIGDDLLMVSTGSKDQPNATRSQADAVDLARLVVAHLPT